MKKPTIKTKKGFFTQYQVFYDGYLIKSFYDKKDATKLRNEINEEQKKMAVFYTAWFLLLSL